MMDRANEFGEIHSGLSSLKSDGWEGRAADHFRSKFKVQTKGWLDAQEAFSSASEAYSSYASTLASAQGQCDGIRSRWKQGRDAVQQAQNNQADARSQAAAEGGIPMFDASCDEGPGRSAMAAAVADFETLVDQVNEAGDLLITALNAGIAKLPERTWWDSVKRTVGSVVKGFVEAVADLVKLGLALSGVPMLFDFGRMLMGQMTWDEFYAKHSTIPMETIAGLAKALWEDPGAFFAGLGKALVDWDTWTDDPGRAIGHLLPDVLIAIATAGTGTAASAGEKATSGAARLARMAHIGKEVFKAILPVNPDDVRALGKLGKNLFTKFTHHGVDAADTVAKLCADARKQVSGLRGGHLMADANKYSDAGHLSGNASHGANNLAGLDHLSGRSSHVGGGAHDLAGASDLAGDTSHAGRGTHNGGLSSTGAPDPGHRSNGVSSAAQPAATPHASAAGDAGTSGHAAPANTAPSASHGAHNNAFMNADTGGATHGAGSTANGATSAPAPGAPATGTHGAGATSAPSGGSHGAASGHSPAGGSPATPVRNEGVGERVATGDAIPPKKPTDSYRVGHDRSITPDEVGSQSAAATDGKPPRKPNNSWTDSDGFSTNRDDFDRVGTDRFGTENRMNSSYLDDSSTHANGQTRGADELVGAGVGRREASVGAQGSYERAGAFGGSDPSRVSHGADGFGGTADFGANAGHGAHGANGVTNSADVGGGIGDASRGTHATGAPTGHGGGHVGADSGTHGGSSTPAQGPHRADPGMPSSDTHGVSRADSAPGHGDTPRTGQGADSTPDAPTIPKKDTPTGDALGGDKQPHGGKHAADTPATHADEAADASKAGHGSGDAHGSGKADADTKQGHDSGERADADPKAKDHSANGKADDTADSARHGDKTEADKSEADKPPSDKSHQADDAAHRDDAEHPKDADDKHSAKNDDADSKSTKDEAHTHKSNKDSDAKSDKDADGKSNKDGDTKAKDHSANGKADDAADSAHHGDKTEADKPASDKSHKEDDAAHHDSDEHPKDTDSETTKKDADPKSKDHSANGKADDADSGHHGDKTEADKSEADKPPSDKSHQADDAAHRDDAEHPKDADDKHSAKNDDADSKSTKDEAHTHKSNKDSDAKSDKDGDTKAKDHSANGKADDAADSAHHGDKTEADKPASDKSHKEDDAAHHDGDEHPKDADDKHSAKNDDADSKSTKDEAHTHKSNKDSDGKSDKDSGERADADPKAKDHSANGKADDAADSARHSDKTEADTHKSDKDSDGKSDKDGDGKSDKDEADTHKSDKDADGKSDKDSDGKSDNDDTDGKSDKDSDGKSDNDDTDGKSDNDDTDGSGTGDDDPPITTEEQYLAKREKLEDYDHGIVPKEQRKEAYPENWDGDSSTIEGLRESVPARGYIEDLDGPDSNKIGTFDALPDGGSISKRPAEVLDGHPYSDWRYSDHYNPEEKRAAWRNDPDIVDGGVKGTHRRYTVQEYVDKYGSTIDRVGPTSGRFFGAMPEGKIAPLETRSMDPGAVHEPYHQYHVNPEKFDGNWEVEVSIIAPDQFQKGGGLQLRFFNLDAKDPTKAINADTLLNTHGQLTGETHVVGTVQEHSFSDLK